MKGETQYLSKFQTLARTFPIRRKRVSRPLRNSSVDPSHAYQGDKHKRHRQAGGARNGGEHRRTPIAQYESQYRSSHDGQRLNDSSGRGIRRIEVLLHFQPPFAAIAPRRPYFKRAGEARAEQQGGDNQRDQTPGGDIHGFSFSNQRQSPEDNGNSAAFLRQ